MTLWQLYLQLFMFIFSAGGFCKAESIGIFYLQRARDARRVYARVVNVRSNHDGSKQLFLSPHGPSQMKLLKMAYEEAKVDVDSVAWIEAHATGTLVRTASTNIRYPISKPCRSSDGSVEIGHSVKSSSQSEQFF